MEQQPPIPPNQGWSRAKGKNAPFSHPWFGGEGGSRFSIYFVHDCNLGQNKMEQQTPIPPNQGWSRAKGKNGPFSHPWFGRFSIYFVQDCSLHTLTLLLLWFECVKIHRYIHTYRHPFVVCVIADYKSFFKIFLHSVMETERLIATIVALFLLIVVIRRARRFWFFTLYFF